MICELGLMVLWAYCPLTSVIFIQVMVSCVEILGFDCSICLVAHFNTLFHGMLIQAESIIRAKQSLIEK